MEYFDEIIKNIHTLSSAILSDLITRGAGDRDSRQLTAAFDRLGVQRNENVGWNFITFGSAAPFCIAIITLVGFTSRWMIPF